MRAIKTKSHSSIITVLLALLVLALPLIPFMAAPARGDADFDRHAMLQSMVDNVIRPGQDSFIAASDSLAIAAEAFTAAPDLKSLADLQSAWRAASDAWEQISLYNMDLWLTALHNRIDKTPVNLEFVAEILNGEGELSESAVDALGSTSRGLPAMEVLIFSHEQSRLEILADLEDERRRQFTLALAQNIARKAREVQAYWSPDGRDYGARFVKADQAGGIVQGAINMLANKIFVRLEQDMQMWLGEPAGITTGQPPDPDLVEARRSGHSLAHIANHLTGIHALFNGSLDDADDALGFDDYLDFLGATYDGLPLSAAMNQRFEAALAAAAAIQEPLAIAVVESPAAVADLYESMRQLLILLRADFKSQLNILITFSDLDGDQ